MAAAQRLSRLIGMSDSRIIGVRKSVRERKLAADLCGLPMWSHLLTQAYANKMSLFH